MGALSRCYPVGGSERGVSDGVGSQGPKVSVPKRRAAYGETHRSSPSFLRTLTDACATLGPLRTNGCRRVQFRAALRLTLT